MYLYLTYMSESGASYEQAMDLARERRASPTCSSRGRSVGTQAGSWMTEDFIDKEVMDAGYAQLKELTWFRFS